MSSTSNTTPTPNDNGSTILEAAAGNPVIEAEPVVTVESSTTPETNDKASPETNDKGSSFNWKTAAIIGAATIGLAILVVAIVLLVKHIRKKKEEGKEEGKDGEKDKEKDNDKSKGNDKDKKEGKDKNAKTTEKEGNDKPETKNFTLFVNGEERIVKGKLNKETGKYQVIIPRTKKSIQDNIVKVSNSNNQIITATQQKKEQSNNELEAIKEQLKTLQGELDVKKNEQDNINQFAKAVNNMGSNLLNNVLGGNILELDDLPHAPVENQNASISKEAINNSMKKEEDILSDSSKSTNVSEKGTELELKPKVIKQEVKNSLETANKAKEEAQGNSLS